MQTWLALGGSAREAEDRAQRTQHFRRMAALDLRRRDAERLAELRAGNLPGTPADIVGVLRRGASHLGLIFLVESADELLAGMELFARQVAPHLADEANGR